MQFHISGGLLRFTDYQPVVTLEADSLAAALDRLAASYPDLRNVLFDRSGAVRLAHRLFLNGDLVSRDELAQPISPDDRVDIMTAISGG
jgi:molybdopterin synthase sulfur carrier subunit